MPDSAQPSRLPDAIEAAISAALFIRTGPLSGLQRIHRDTLAELLRCVSASDPARPFRIAVRTLCDYLGRSVNTVTRYLSALEAAGWIHREQPLRGSRRHGFRVAWTTLTPQALEALALQRSPKQPSVPKPCSKGNRFQRIRRIPPDLADLAARIGPARVVWLMARCRSAGRRLQEFAAQALQADSPAGYVLRALSARKCSSVPQSAQQCPAVPSGGDARRDARDVLREIDAGPRTEAGRRAGLAMLRAVRGSAAPG